jgi:hypothetical protein
MWIRKARAGCSLWRTSTESDVFEGWHDGYAQLPDPVMHRRRITLEKRQRQIVIEDTLRMSKAHEIELLFHCSEQCRVDPVANGYRLSRPGRVVTLELPQAENATCSVYTGSTAPIFGWVSRRFDEKRPAPTIVWRARLSRDATLRSEIRC